MAKTSPYAHQKFISLGVRHNHGLPEAAGFDVVNFFHSQVLRAGCVGDFNTDDFADVFIVNSALELVVGVLSANGPGDNANQIFYGTADCTRTGPDQSGE
eukprot:SAG22_NODE_1106_length_5552_cov_3.049331_5_plen_100_part_00